MPFGFGTPAPPPPPPTFQWFNDEQLKTIMDVVPVLTAITAIFGVLSFTRAEWRIPMYGMGVFILTWLAHLIVADDLKEQSGFKNLSSDAFGSFTTLLGLVFSILLGQTYQYYVRPRADVRPPRAAFATMISLQTFSLFSG